jgi:hypothetical protein
MSIIWYESDPSENFRQVAHAVRESDVEEGRRWRLHQYRLGRHNRGDLALARRDAAAWRAPRCIRI